MRYNPIVEHLNFDTMASIYDGTRIFDEASFARALDYVVGRFPPEKYPELFEPGIGTGRIAIPFAERGYKVTGADISTEMLKKLKEKLKRRPLPVTFIRQDITELPFKDSSFDLAVAVHVFHLIKEWKKALAEVFRILKPGRPLILMYTGGGKEVPWVQDKYRELCADCGHPATHIGAAGGKLREYLKENGFRLEVIENRWQWTRKSRVDEAFEGIRQRHYGMTRLVPESIHLDVMKKLESETLRQYGTLEKEVEVPHQITLLIVTAP